MISIVLVAVLLREFSFPLFDKYIKIHDRKIYLAGSVILGRNLSTRNVCLHVLCLSLFSWTIALVLTVYIHIQLCQEVSLRIILRRTITFSDQDGENIG